MATYAKLPSGSYRVQIRKGGIYRSKTFRLKRDAQAWAASIESQINQIKATGYTSPKGLTVGRLVDLYIEGTPKQSETKQRRLAVLSKRFASIPVAAFNGVHLQSFVDERLAEGAGGPTITMDLAYVSAVCKWARAVKHIDVDTKLPGEAVQALKHRGLRTTSVHRDRVPTERELARLAEYFADSRSKVPMGLIMQFAVASAFRIGEVLRIRAEDVDREARTVIIRDRKDPKVKAGNDQVVPLLEDAWFYLTAQMGNQAVGRIFPYNQYTVRDNWRKACVTLGIEDLHIHDLRHYGTVMLFRVGLDIPRVSIITGHRNWNTLRRYTNLTAKDVHAAVDR